MYKVYECKPCQGKGYVIIRGKKYRFQRFRCAYCNGKGTIREQIIEKHPLMPNKQNLY